MEKRAAGQRKPLCEGDRFFRLMAIRFVKKEKFGKLWEFKCDCGNVSCHIDMNVKRGMIKSCGCLKREASSVRLTTHGMSRFKEYQIYHAMIERCYNDKNKAYENYGGRGISVCNNWKNSFENFFADMGARPSSKHSLDRINNNGDYCAGNCRWATVDEQLANRRTTIKLAYKGVVLPIAEWSKRLGINTSTLKNRIKRGWTIERCIEQPVEFHKIKQTC